MCKVLLSVHLFAIVLPEIMAFMEIKAPHIQECLFQMNYFRLDLLFKNYSGPFFLVETNQAHHNQSSKPHD